MNMPTTSLGDLNSKFQIQGDPTLPRINITGFFTGQTSIAGPDAGSDYFAVKDSFSVTRGNHSLKFGGEISYEQIVHDTLLDNYGVFAFNASKTGNAYADFLLGLPSTMTQDAPIRKLDNGAYYSLFVQDDFRIHPRVTLNLGLRYDLQQPLIDPQDRKLAYVPGRQSEIAPTAPEGLLFPGDEGVSRGIVAWDKNNLAPRLGIAWDPRGDGRMSVRAGAGVFFGSITGNEWNTTADNQPFTVRQSFPTVFTLSDPYRNQPGGVGPFPFEYNTASPPAVHISRAGVRAIPRLRVAEDVSDERHRREAVVLRHQRERVLCGSARTESAGEHRPQLPGLRPRRDHRQRERPPAVVDPASSAPRACSSRFSRVTIMACS